MTMERFAMRYVFFSALLLAVLALPAIPEEAQGGGSSLAYFVNAANEHDHGLQMALPATFGTGEFTFEVWIRPDASFPVGPTPPDTPQQLTNWSDADNEPYGGCCWWFEGNFLLDGHNNASFDQGTFSLQFYGGGRLRWLFGDGGDPGAGGIWSVGAFPAATTPSLLDGAWHQVTLVRRWDEGTGADLELWIDGLLVDAESTPLRANMRQWWDAWTGFPTGQEGWFWGAEKQAAIGVLSQYEDFKGEIDELRLWDRAKTAAEILADWSRPVSPGASGLVGLFRFDEAAGIQTCDTLAPGTCMSLIDMKPGYWSSAQPPLAQPLFTDGFESGDLAAWSEVLPP